jgi:pyridoxal phosphate enzyme (YggS family)
MEPATDALRKILDRIGKAAEQTGRRPEEITLVAVTKTVPRDKVLPLLQAGIRHVGENRVQEALGKYSELRARDSEIPKFHLIGQLQTNKAKKAVAFFDMIQSLDRLDLAQDLNRHAEELGKKQSCLIEVKISPEATKSGLTPEQLEAFLAQVKSLSSLEIKGLMGIAPLTATAAEARPYFTRLRKIFEKSKLDILSMGMSSDFETAIEEGATMVRIGSALFGPRR